MPDTVARMFNPTHRYENICLPDCDTEPTVRWQRDIRGTTGLAVHDTLCIAAVDQGVVALQADGTPAWRFTTAGSFMLPTVGKQSVYVTSAGSTDDEYGYLHAVDIKSGTENWRFELTGKGSKTSPAVVGETVYVANGGSESLYALDADTGALQWSLDDIGPAYTSLAVVDETVYVGTQGRLFDDNDGAVYAIDTDTGTVQWRSATNDEIASPLTVTADSVYVGGKSGLVYAIDSDTGDKNWQYSTGDSVESSPAVVGGTVYIGSDDNSVYALDATIGTVEWQFETNSTVRSSPLVVNDTVLVGSTDGSIYALTAADGSKRWHLSLSNQDTSLFADHVSAGPVALEDMIYAANGETIYGLRTNEEAQHSSKPNQITASEKSQDCPSCQSDLSEYGNPNFCPECGAKQ